MYHYYQQNGGEEVWRPVKATELDKLDAMFVTILGVDVPVADDLTKEQLCEIKYKGPLYFDLDDAASPASTAAYAVELVEKLQEQGVEALQLEIYASGGKGFHILVPEACFLNKPPKAGMAMLPAIYKEMAFKLAVDSMDFRVYTARKGRMLRRPNVQRSNGLYKVRISYDELLSLVQLGQMSKSDAEAKYAEICSAPRDADKVNQDVPSLAGGLGALFDECKSKVTKTSARLKKQKPTRLPKELPSFDALLRGEGIKDDASFQQIALQVAITAHAQGLARDKLLEAATGLCETHVSDGNRYDTPGKRRDELARMWDYTDGNPCYAYSQQAITGLLTHTAPDLRGLAVTAEEVAEGMLPMDESDGEYDHAGVIMTKQGLFALTENGNKLITAVSFDNVTELRSIDTGQISVLEAEVFVNGRSKGRSVLELDTFNSTNGLNKVVMRHGQSFSGNDVQARGMYMQTVQKAKKAGRSMYVTGREGLDFIQIPFHEDEEVRRGFVVWSDSQGVALPPTIAESGLQMKFVGYPDPLGRFQTDLSNAPVLTSWLKEEGNKEELLEFLKNLLYCQSPSSLGKLLGWMVASHYRMLFHAGYGQFPLLHINGPAGSGKTQMAKLFSNLHYYLAESKMLTPVSTLFAVNFTVSGSASIPLILDEFKPGEMSVAAYGQFKLMLRDAYNCRVLERGGGNRDSQDYRSVHKTNLSAPVCYIAEASESETALMERTVLLTLTKPPVIRAQEYFHKFTAAGDKKHILGILGKYISAQTVQRVTVAALKEEFGPIYDQTRKELMLQADEIGKLSDEEIARKSAAKERTVFNYAVVRFGLQKLKNLLGGIFGEEFEEVFREMAETACSSVEDVQTQTVPEWLKVLNEFAYMARLDDLSEHFLQEGNEFAFVQHAGKECIELDVRACYFKYRAYTIRGGLRPLFPSTEAFMHAMNNLPALAQKGMPGTLGAPAGVHVLYLDELRAAGFRAPSRKENNRKA